MPTRLISVIPAHPGHFVSIQESEAFDNPPNPWGPWREVVAWGFTESGGLVPLSLLGAPPEWANHKIEGPDGKEIK